MKYFWIAIMAVLIVGGATAVFSYISNRYDCHVNWRDSGLEYRYNARAGCQIRKGDGWLPADKYRFE